MNVRSFGQMIAVSWGAATDAGKVRNHNEDSALAQPPVFVVADGMGGHAAGEIASGIAVAELRKVATSAPVLRADEVLATLARANEAILEAAADGEGKAGMGTTVVGLALVEENGEDQWLAFNIGDSRLYRSFGGVMEQISVDHSLVQELYEAGAITASQRRDHPRGNVVTRVLGTDPGSVVDHWKRRPVQGERFLLCSDGLTAELNDATIAEVLASDANAPTVAGRLIEMAVNAGGRDNVTAVIIDVTSGPT
jgi:protein phosphatase